MGVNWTRTTKFGRCCRAVPNEKYKLSTKGTGWRWEEEQPEWFDEEFKDSVPRGLLRASSRGYGTAEAFTFHTRIDDSHKRGRSHYIYMVETG